MKISLRSFSDPAAYYEVDTDIGTCSCPAFQTERWCKHLTAVGRYKQRNVTLSARPSYSQALSAVVKSIRIRNIDEGAYWLNYCWGFREKLTGSQFRTVRRLLIGAAEDGHSIAVMEKVADNFMPLLAKDAEFPPVLAEFVRICKIPNWWHPSTNGPDYIRCGMLANRRCLYDQQKYKLEHCLSAVATAIEAQDMVSALFWMFKSGEAWKGAGLALALDLYVIALARNHAPAVRLLTNVYRRHGKALSNDNNFLGQAVWLLAGGSSPVIDDIETVTHGEVRQLLEKVNATPPYPVPGWCCDGIHCTGNDVRYAGMWDRMYAVCRQYDHYQRLSPDDPWLEDQSYCLDGLEIKQS